MDIESAPVHDPVVGGDQLSHATNPGLHIFNQGKGEGKISEILQASLHSEIGVIHASYYSAIISPLVAPGPQAEVESEAE